MKFRWLFMIMLITVISLAACSDNNDNNSENGGDIDVVSEVEGKVRISLAGWDLEDGIDPVTGIETTGFNSFLKAEFEPRYPNIELEVYQEPWENAQAKQSAMLQSNDVDLIYTGGAFASQWMQQGLIREINDLIADDSNFDPSIYLAGLWENSYSSVAFDGETRFGLPAVLGKRVTIYDTQLFEEWGVEPLSENPSPEEVLEKAKQMTGENPETGEQNYGLWFSGNALNASLFVALTHAFGAEGAKGSLDDLKNIEWKLNEPAMVKVFEWLAEAAKYPPIEFVNGDGSETFGLENNNVAIALDHSGAATIGEYRATDNTDLLDRYETTLNLGPNGEGWVAMDPIIMAKNADHVEASWEVMKFLAGYERQKWDYENFQGTPTLADPDFVGEEDKFVQSALEIADVTVSVLMDEANPFFSSEIAPAVNSFISLAANDDTPDIQEYLDQLQSRAESWSANQ